MSLSKALVTKYLQALMLRSLQTVPLSIYMRRLFVFCNVFIELLHNDLNAHEHGSETFINDIMKTNSVNDQKLTKKTPT